MKVYPQRIKLVCDICWAETYRPVAGEAHEEEAISEATAQHNGGSHGRPVIQRREPMTVEQYERWASWQVEEYDAQDDAQ